MRLGGWVDWTEVQICSFFGSSHSAPGYLGFLGRHVRSIRKRRYGHGRWHGRCRWLSRWRRRRCWLCTRRQWKLLCRTGRGLHSLRRRLRGRWPWLRGHVICRIWSRPVHAGVNLQVCWVWWRFRCCSPQEGLHLLHYHLLPELAAVAPIATLASVGAFLIRVV